MTNSTEIALWRAPELGAELLRGRFCDFSYDVHTHETACFALLTEGAIRIRMRGSEFTARRGDLYAIDADQAHAGWPVDGAGWRQRTVYVDMRELRARAGDATHESAMCLDGPIIRDATLAGLLLAVHRDSERQGPLLVRETRYARFAARLVSRHARAARPMQAGRADRAVRLAREFLDSRLDDRVSLAEIADSAGLPRFQLLRAFERSTGMSPHAYQRQARVRLAQHLIRRGEALSAVAAAAGFTDQAHLTRVFRRALAVTPGSYRSAVCG